MELIDRQALRAAHGLGTDCHDCKLDRKSCQYDRDYSLMDFCEWLDDAPTIDAVPVRQGEWIEKDEDFQAYLECSNCNMVFPVTVGWSFTAKTNYCPNCGARMDGERREG